VRLAVIRLRLGPADLMRCRFAISPLWETVEGVRSLLDPAGATVHLPWLRRATGDLRELAAAVDLAPLAALLPPVGYVPDFLTPPPDSPLAEIDGELERLRATPADQVAVEFGFAFEDRAVPAAARALVDDPARAPDLLADLLAACWERLLEPIWARLRDLLDGDILYRGRRFAVGGIETLLADIHPTVSWRDGEVRIRSWYDHSRDLDDLGLLFVPSAFAWPRPRVMLDPPWQPALLYPARGVSRLWEPRPADPDGEHPGQAALAALLGRTRSRLLADLAEPTSTTRLAARHRMSAATVSAHLAVLRTAGLATAHRVGRQVLYEQTPLGCALVGGTT
jgi:DNA-binding transcriptional ArsR family regulator